MTDMMTLKEAKDKLVAMTDQFRREAKALNAYIRVLESQQEEPATEVKED
jgi:hypothetical protein